MTELKKVLIPDIGDFKDVPVIEILVKAGDEVKENNAEQPTTEDNNNKNVKPVVSEPINSQIKK